MKRKVFQMRTNDETEAAMRMIAAKYNVTLTEAVKVSLRMCVADIVARDIRRT